MAKKKSITLTDVQLKHFQTINKGFEIASRNLEAARRQREHLIEVILDAHKINYEEVESTNINGKDVKIKYIEQQENPT